MPLAEIRLQEGKTEYMRNIYLIDFENVGSEGLNGVLNLTEDDAVVLFYSVKSDKLAIRTHIQIGKSPAAFEYFEVTVGGKNALDHQLSTYLGYLVAKDEAERYYIVSRDNGYQYISRFWGKKAERASVECIPSVRASLQVADTFPRDREVRRQIPMGSANEMEGRKEVPQTATEGGEGKSPMQQREEFLTQAAQVPQAVPSAPEQNTKRFRDLDQFPLYTIISPSLDLNKKTMMEEKEKVSLPPAPKEKESHAVPLAIREDTKPQHKAEQPQQALAPAAAKEEDRPAQYRETEVTEGNAQEKGKANQPNRKRQNKPSMKKGNPPAEKQSKENKAEKEKVDKGDTAPVEEHQVEGKRKGKPSEPSGEKRQGGFRSQPTAEEKSRIDGELAAYESLPLDLIHTLILSGSKQKLCNCLRKNLGQEKGLELYNTIKGILWK